MMAAKAYENEQKQYLINDINYLSNILNNQKVKNRFADEGYIRNILSKFQSNKHTTCLSNLSRLLNGPIKLNIVLFPIFFLVGPTYFIAL